MDVSEERPAIIRVSFTVTVGGFPRTLVNLYRDTSRHIADDDYSVSDIINKHDKWVETEFRTISLQGHTQLLTSSSFVVHLWK
jgi:hypothetical protein